MYSARLIFSFVVSFSLCRKAVGHIAQTEKIVPKAFPPVALPPSSSSLSSTLGTPGSWSWKKGDYTVEFNEFKEPRVSFELVGTFVTRALRELENRRIARHKDETDNIGESTTHPNGYWYSPTQSHLSFHIVEDYEHIGSLAYYLIDMVLQGVLAFAQHDKENGVHPSEFILWQERRYLADGELGTLHPSGLSVNGSGLTARNISMSLGVEDWEYSSGDYMALLYEFEPPYLDRTAVSAFVRAARYYLQQERGSRLPAATVPHKSFNYDYGGVTIEIGRPERMERLSFAAVDVVLRAVGAYAFSHENVPQNDIVLHRRGILVTEGVLRRTPLQNAVSSQ